MFWNLNYWDSVSTLAGEVASPGRTLPRALGIAVIAVVAMYVLPLLAAVGVLPAADKDWVARLLCCRRATCGWPLARLVAGGGGSRQRGRPV